MSRLALGLRSGLIHKTSTTLPPSFLAPALLSDPRAPLPKCHFSTSSPALHRRRRHGNPQRGVSALRRTGLRFPVGMSRHPLPQPVLDPKKRSKVESDEKHGLWGFFNKDKQLLTQPLEEAKHGRAWSFRELRNKSWEDIHSLWWICCKERNRIATESAERERVKAGGGDAEGRGRDKEVRRTMKAIKQVLTERWYSWEDARKLAEKDAEVDLNADLETPAYRPRKSSRLFQSAPTGEAGKEGKGSAAETTESK